MISRQCSQKCRSRLPRVEGWRATPSVGPERAKAAILRASSMIASTWSYT